jgi:hypothetical protein
MTKYKTKPQFVEAEQWFPGKKIVGVTEEDIPIGGRYFHAWTDTLMSLQVGVEAGDWIVTRIDKPYREVIKDRIFRATFVTLNDEPIPDDITRVETEVIRRKRDE